jgi:hypothetical protein
MRIEEGSDDRWIRKGVDGRTFVGRTPRQQARQTLIPAELLRPTKILAIG